MGGCDCTWGAYCEYCHPEAFGEPFTQSEVDAIHAAMKREEAANDTQLPAEVTQEPETPFDNERADIQYRESMKDAGRGHLLR